MSERARRAAALAVAVLLLVVATGLLPRGLGGSTTYLVVRGASMSPAYSRGDLAVLRPSDAYRVGEVAAYRSATTGRVVLHRIASISGDTHAFKGDANAFTDPEQVPRGRVLGRATARLPLAGSALLWLTNPFNTLLLALLVVLLVRERRRPEQTQVSDPLGGPRIVPVSSMSLPRELPVADIVDPDVMLRLAEQYDRPVLHDAEQGALYVIESTVLFRSRLTRPGVVAPPALAVVRDLPTPQEPKPLRRPTAAGRDWRYDRTAAS